MKKYTYKSSKCTPSREVLDQYVFDFGEDAAQAYFNLSEAKYNSIMFDKITTKLPERFQYVEPTPDEPEVPALSPDFNELKNYICRHFKRILAKHRATSTRNIDVRAMSPYDRAMEVLTDLLYYNSDYTYIDDKHTEEYISFHLSSGTSALRKEAYRAKKCEQLDEDMDLPYTDTSEEDAANVMGRLSKSKQEILNNLVIGFSQQELADAYKVDKQRINDEVQKIRKILE